MFERFWYFTRLVPCRHLPSQTHSDTRSTRAFRSDTCSDTFRFRCPVFPVSFSFFSFFVFFVFTVSISFQFPSRSTCTFKRADSISFLAFLFLFLFLVFHSCCFPSILPIRIEAHPLSSDRVNARWQWLGAHLWTSVRIRMCLSLNLRMHPRLRWSLSLSASDICLHLHFCLHLKLSASELVPGCQSVCICSCAWIWSSLNLHLRLHLHVRLKLNLSESKCAFASAFAPESENGAESERAPSCAFGPAF